MAISYYDTSYVEIRKISPIFLILQKKYEKNITRNLTKSNTRFFSLIKKSKLKQE